MGKEPAKPGPLARRPDNSAFMQRLLPWSPMLTASTVLPFMYCMAALCLFLGVSLFVTVQGTQEVKMDYTEAGTCDVCFRALQNVLGDVFFYYGLQNFHQNLRKYMDSCDDVQMVGRKQYLKNPSLYCEPYIRDEKGLPIAPCGAVANDSFSMEYHDPLFVEYHDPLFVEYHDPMEFHSLCTGKASPGTRTRTSSSATRTWRTRPWNSPLKVPKNQTSRHRGTTKPPSWKNPVYKLRNPNNNGFINEDLIVWMREAAFPNFKKLYGILKRIGPFTDRQTACRERQPQHLLQSKSPADHSRVFSIYMS
ncbi:hypothetical protein CRUP_012360 [Coryphaenoides rupestris]|nr:hypothetical protein CRUP_012360 [Coryphaenoides rupestris]